MSFYFSKNYQEARKRFCEAVSKAGGTHERLPLTAKGPQDSDLSLDIASFGDVAADKVLVYSSGLHGVEGFAGSAVQLAVLDRGLKLPPGLRVVLVHILNPFGMSWLRRVNENNVDLNRNFLSSSEVYRGSEPLYGKIDGYLNRNEGFFPFNTFWPGYLANVVKYGFRELRDTIVRGQYDFAEGLFYGGDRLQEGPRRYREWLEKNVKTMSNVRFGFCLDLHTGLGRRGEEVLFLETNQSTLTPQFGRRLTPASDPVGYKVRGGLDSLTAEIFSACPWMHLTQEFGTNPIYEVLKALRAENIEFQKGEKAGLAARELKEVMSPSDTAWQDQAIALGLGTFDASLAWLTAQ